jgi:uncharacterized protein
VSTFADSSALVKLYADEDGHEHIRELVSVAVAQLARVEVPAALWRKQRMGELPAEDARLLTADFEADYFGTDTEPPRFAAVAATGRSSTKQPGCAHRAAFEPTMRSSCPVPWLCAGPTKAARPSQLSTAICVVAAAAEGFELVPSNLPDPD